MPQGMPGAGPPQGAAGPTGPATVAPNSSGLVQRGKALGNLGRGFLVKARQFLPPTTSEGQAVAKAIATLGKTFSNDHGDIERQEIKLAAQNMSPVQAPNPQQGEAWKQAVQSRVPPGIGGGAPPG